ncbi:MAG: hypothetical protein ACRDVC_07210 [Acidimicrobiales bacterium]
MLTRRSFITFSVIAALSASIVQLEPTPAFSAQSPTVTAFDAPYVGSPTTSGSAVVGVTTGANGVGYYVLRANGEVDAYGAISYGSLVSASLPVGITATGIALDAATGGYWILSSNGAVKAFNAPSYGQTLVPSGGWGQHPAAVAIAAAPDGAGYYVLRANGAVYGYGVKTHGSLAGTFHYGATAPVLAVAIAVDPSTGGYWVATSTGGVAAFDAPGDGTPSIPVTTKYDGNPVTSLAARPDGSGYYVLHANGDIDDVGAPSHGSIATASSMPEGGFASALAIDPTTGGYFEAVDDTPLGGYYNPLRGLTSLLPQDVDQGVDYCASGPIYAIGDGVVANVYSSGWPSGLFISYRLTSGPARASTFMTPRTSPPLSRWASASPRTPLSGPCTTPQYVWRPAGPTRQDLSSTPPLTSSSMARTRRPTG